MRVYICDKVGCEKIIRTEEELYTLIVNDGEEGRELHLCKECLDAVLNFINTASYCKGTVIEEKPKKKMGRKHQIKNEEPKEVVEEPKEIVEEPKEATEGKKNGRITISDKIDSIGGIDKLMESVCRREKSIPEWETELGLSKNSLRTYLSMHKISIKDYADKHNIQLGKDKTEITRLIATKIKEVGLDNLMMQLINKEKTMDDVATEFGIKRSQLNTYFHNNYISVKEYKNRLDTKKKKEANKEKEEYIKNNRDMTLEKLNSKATVNMGMKTVAKGELSSYEENIEVKSGSCFPCAYRDLDSNTCGYTLLTGKSRRGGKGKCNHFVDVNKL